MVPPARPAPPGSGRSLAGTALRPWIYRRRNLLAALPLVTALLVNRWEWEDDLTVWALSLALCLAGVGIRVWARRHNGYGLRGPRGLATEGPYAVVRNPLYWGNTLLLAGSVMASEAVWLVPIAIAWCLGVYHLAALHEEVRLAQRFAESYRSYRRRVPAWIPRSRSRFRAPVEPRVPLFRALGSQIALLLVLLPPAVKEVGSSHLIAALQGRAGPPGTCRSAREGPAGHCGRRDPGSRGPGREETEGRLGLEKGTESERGGPWREPGDDRSA